MTIRLPFGDAFTRTVGDGPLLLTLHGIGFDHTMLSPFLDPLGDVARVVYYDQRGNGRSRASAAGSLSHEAWVDDADALRAALGEERMVVLGHSYGAFLALEFALRHPNRIRGLVLSGVAPVVDYPDIIMANALARGGPPMAARVHEFLSRTFETDAELSDAYRALLPLYFHPETEAEPLVEALMRDLQTSAEALGAATTRCLPQYDVSALLSEIHAPTLVIAGVEDWLTPLDLGARRVAERIEGAKLVEFAHSGHFPYLEQSDEFIRIVRGFVTDLP